MNETGSQKPNKKGGLRTRKAQEQEQVLGIAQYFPLWLLLCGEV